MEKMTILYLVALGMVIMSIFVIMWALKVSKKGDLSKDLNKDGHSLDLKIDSLQDQEDTQSLESEVKMEDKEGMMALNLNVKQVIYELQRIATALETIDSKWESGAYSGRGD